MYPRSHFLYTHFYSYICRGYQQREVFEGVEFALPVSQELLQQLEDWQEDLSPITEEQVREEMGLPPPVSEKSWDTDEYDARADRMLNRKKNKRRDGLFASGDDDWIEEDGGWYSGETNSDYSNIDLADSWLGEAGLSSGSGNQEDSGINWLEDETKEGLLFDDQFSDGQSAHRQGADNSLEQTSTNVVVDDGTWSEGLVSDKNDMKDNLGEWVQEYGSIDDWEVPKSRKPRGWEDRSTTTKRNQREKPAAVDNSSWNETKTDYFEDHLSWWDEDNEDASETNSTLESIEDAEKQPKASDTSFIEVISGPFKDFEGIILDEIKGSEKVRAEIDVFGKPTIVEIHKDDFTCQ